MRLEVGKIYEGKVTGITKFGAFVDVVEQGQKVTGMVHISEIANTYVSEIKDHVKEGQSVKVKVLSVSDDGKTSMSIKKAAEGGRAEQKQSGEGGQRRPNDGRRPEGYRRRNAPAETGGQPPEYIPTRSTLTESGDQSFEDMLSKFKASSEEKIGEMKRAKENKRRSNSHRK